MFASWDEKQLTLVFHKIRNHVSLHWICRFRDPQPDYSAFREASYGHSTLAIKNRRHAIYHWNRNDDGKKVATDSFTLYNQYWWVLLAVLLFVVLVIAKLFCVTLPLLCTVDVLSPKDPNLFSHWVWFGLVWWLFVCIVYGPTIHTSVFPSVSFFQENEHQTYNVAVADQLHFMDTTIRNPYWKLYFNGKHTSTQANIESCSESPKFLKMKTKCPFAMLNFLFDHF